MNPIVLDELLKAKLKIKLMAKPGKPALVPKIGDDGLVTTAESPDKVFPFDSDGKCTAVDQAVLDAIMEAISEAITEFMATAVVVTQVSVGGITPGPAVAIGVGTGNLQ